LTCTDAIAGSSYIGLLYQYALGHSSWLGSCKEGCLKHQTDIPKNLKLEKNISETLNLNPY
jgi:hypothetical protein